jgi:predicted SAM-dependent methyltransferase
MPTHPLRLAARAPARAGARVVGAARLRRELRGLDRPYWVELGAGTTRRDGWIGTDISWRARLHLDATRPWPFPPGSVSHVYGDNMIEHVPLAGARALLRHAAAALRPGGRIRLVTPDAERCAEVYLEGGDRAQALLAAHRAAGERAEHRIDILRAVFVAYEHDRGYAWDLASLRAELTAAGFTSVERVELQESVDPALRGLEWRVLPIDRTTMLAVEAVRRIRQ